MKVKVSPDLEQFIDDLNNGLLDEATGYYIAKHFGIELQRLIRDVQDYNELSYDDESSREDDLEDVYDTITGHSSKYYLNY